MRDRALFLLVFLAAGLVLTWATHSGVPYTVGDTLTEGFLDSVSHHYAACSGTSTSCVFYVGPGASLSAPFEFRSLHVDNRLAAGLCPAITVVASYNTKCSYGMFQADNYGALSNNYGEKVQFVASAQNQYHSNFQSQYMAESGNRVLHIADFDGTIMTEHPNHDSAPDEVLFDQFPAYLILNEYLTVTNLINAGDELPGLDEGMALRNDDLSAVAAAIEETVAAMTLLPTANLVSVVADHESPTSHPDNVVTFTFDRPVNIGVGAFTFDAGDTNAWIWSFSAISTTVFACAITDALSGTYALSIDLAQVTDTCDNRAATALSSVSTTTSISVILEALEPTILSDNPQTSNSVSNRVTINFTADVFGLTMNAIHLDSGGTNASISSFAAITARSYAINITGLAFSGSYSIHIIPGEAIDGSGNTIASGSATYEVDVDAPTATTTSLNTSPTTESTNVITFTFSEPVALAGNTDVTACVTLSDVSSGAVITSVIASPSSSSAETLTVAIASATLPGAYTVHLEPVFADAAGNVVGSISAQTRTGSAPLCTFTSSCCPAAFGPSPSLVVEVSPEDTAWPADNTNNDLALHHVRDIAYNPKYNQIFLANSATDDVTIIDLAENGAGLRRIRDRTAFHYMANISSLAFDDRGFFAVCNENPNDYNGEMLPNFFMGPTLYDSNMVYPNIINHLSDECDSTNDICYWVHSDMLHEAPNCMGIVHDSQAGGGGHGHVYWAFDGHHNHLVRFDFRAPHGPFDMDHAEAFVRRYPDVELTRVEGVPGHMVFHHDLHHLFISDPGGRRVLQLDTAVGEAARDACLDYPIYTSRAPNFEYSIFECTSYRVFADFANRGMPSGMAQDGNIIYIGEHDTGRIVALDMESGAELGALETGSANALYGLEVINGNIYFVNGTHMVRVERDTECPEPSTALLDAYPPAELEVDDSCSITSTNASQLQMDCTIQLHPNMEMPGYGNTEFTDVYAQSTNCSSLNFDALLLSGYICHPCLPIDPCYNGGHCAMEWVVDVNLGDSAVNTTTGFVCDCTGTGYTGSHCQTAVATTTFSACDPDVLVMRASVLARAGLDIQAEQVRTCSKAK